MPANPGSIRGPVDFGPPKILVPCAHTGGGIVTWMPASPGSICGPVDFGPRKFRPLRSHSRRHRDVHARKPRLDSRLWPIRPAAPRRGLFPRSRSSLNHLVIVGEAAVCRDFTPGDGVALWTPACGPGPIPVMENFGPLRGQRRNRRRRREFPASRGSAPGEIAAGIPTGPASLITARLIPGPNGRRSTARRRVAPPFRGRPPVCDGNLFVTPDQVDRLSWQEWMQCFDR